jgi:hypothetical protein
VVRTRGSIDVTCIAAESPLHVIPDKTGRFGGVVVGDSEKISRTVCGQKFDSLHWWGVTRYMRGLI